MAEDGIKSIPLGQLMEMRKNGKEIKGVRSLAAGNPFIKQ